ncbi:MAG: AbrB/MazE/SpoVT family DNA-binding domain-containing protein [Bacteroidales bacterium]|jgi:antitoxin MazE|nr:AbrB/MazE/SpoVT family DNA-binding domain-containing protein [Bacteroidales bacterium]
MEVNVINIGNSKGIRLSKSILEQYNISDTLEMILEKGRIILKSKSKPRKDWEKSFKQMNAEGDDRLIIKNVFDDETFEEKKGNKTI